MIIRRKDKAIKLLRFINIGIIKLDDYIALIDKVDGSFSDHLKWTLKEFESLSECKNDVELVECFLAIEKKKTGNRKLKTTIAKLTVNDYLRALNYVREAMEDISTAISNIKQPPMSAEKRQAGFGDLNFGIQGMARSVAGFEMMRTIDVYDLSMSFIITSLSQSAAISVCEHKHSDIITKKNK